MDCSRESFSTEARAGGIDLGIETILSGSRALGERTVKEENQEQTLQNSHV